jgi:hypothetical protein
MRFRLRAQAMSGLRSATNKSANIGLSLTTPAHDWPDQTKRTLTSLLCPLGCSRAGSRHVRCVGERFGVQPGAKRRADIGASPARAACVFGV